MDRVVYKYPVRIGEETSVSCAAPAKPVHFGVQGGQMFVWVEHGLGPVSTSVSFCVVGTGHPIPDGFEHVQSIFDGPFVWHLYRSPW